VDCHFCAISTEPPPSERKRACGSACNEDLPEDICIQTETCVGIGSGGSVPNLGIFSDPEIQADLLFVFDFSRWLIVLDDAAMLMTDVDGVWTEAHVVYPAVNPGFSGGSGGPPGSVEAAFPWSAFGCTGCPDACECPGFGPDSEFRFTMLIARGNFTLDYEPDGPVEDVLSETVAGVATTSTNSCPGFGIGNTACEIADGSTDAFVPPVEAADVPGGRSEELQLVSAAGSSITLNWNPSCSTADTDYEVYEGELGNWYSHVPVSGLCTTSGAMTATFEPARGDRYYLIVPTDGATEGSYGVDSAGVERPTSTAACRQQVLGNCP
jgi:hypothetical protein